MQKSEAAKLLKFLKDSYSRYYSGQTKEEYDLMVDSWAYQFQQDDFLRVFQAVNAAIAAKLSDFPPSIGEIKARLIDLTDPDVSTFDEIWDLLLKCIRRGSVHAQEDWEKLPEEAKELITPEAIREIAMTENVNMTVEKAGYYSRWKIYRERRRIEKSVPASVREVMEQAKEKALEMRKASVGQITESAPKKIDDSKAAETRRNQDHVISVAELIAKKRAELEARPKDGTDDG